MNHNDAVMNEAVERILVRLQDMDSRWLIALAGVPGSGKTTLARQLCERVNHQCQAAIMTTLGMDGFHLSKAQLNTFPDPQQAFARRGAPWTFDPQHMSECLRQVRESFASRHCDWPGFEHDIGDPVEAAHQVAADCRIILVEGLYLLYPEDGWLAVSEQFDERWFYDVPVDIAMERLCGRHMQAWGMTKEQAMTQIAANDRLNAQLVWPTRMNADWCFNS